MRILIVGNGFDLEHGLLTKYTDFLSQTMLFNTNAENDSEIHNIIKKSHMRNEFCSIISANTWLQYFIQRGQLNGDGWIDFEQEISNVIGTFDMQMAENAQIEVAANKENPLSCLFESFYCSEQNNELSELRYKGSVITGTMRNPIVTYFSEFLYQELRRFVRAFEIYCVCIGDIAQSNLNNLLNKQNFNAFNAVLSFNYTKTYEALYDAEKTQYCYIHGAAQSDPQSTNMVLGIDDALEKESMNHAFAFVKFKKYFQRINLQTGSEYRDWIGNLKWTNEALKKGSGGKSNIFIMGHSMGRTDHEVLREFFDLAQHGALISIFYHNEDAKINLIEQTIEIIGKENLIKQVHGKDRTIRFVNQYDSANGLFKK